MEKFLVDYLNDTVLCVRDAEDRLGEMARLAIEADHKWHAWRNATIMLDWDAYCPWDGQYAYAERDRLISAYQEEAIFFMKKFGKMALPYSKRLQKRFGAWEFKLLNDYLEEVRK